MKIRSFAAAGAAAALMVAVPSGVAAAQDDGPGSVVLSSNECREVALTATLDGGVYSAGTRFEIAVFVGPNAGGAISEQKALVEVTFDNPGETSFVLPRDSFGGEAFVKAIQVAGPDSGVFGEKVITVNTSCARDDDDVTPTTTSTPTTTPPPPADEDPEPESPTNVFNCDDFATRADAQAKFNEDPSDPHNLDWDKNGIACERAFDENIGVQDEDDILTPEVATPQGGVATGVGPA